MNSPLRLGTRNLFGIRLNQDQLTRDLTTIWKDQVERQKRNWNFDFETLQPINDSNTTQIDYYSCSSPIRQIKRFEWTQVRLKPQINSRKCELNEVEEFDEALVVPHFYQHQRVEKMHKEIIQNEQMRLKQVRLKAVAKVQGKTGQVADAEKLAVSAKTKKVSKRKKQSAIVPSLIITFSENRKDTLRSALGKKDECILKQQTIVGMFKKQKRLDNSFATATKPKKR